MRQPSLSRRRLLRWLGALPLGFLPRPTLSQSLDQGIGGTGARPTEGPGEEGDRGIGGTGVLGTIRRFGSIVVNDLRIAYPKDVAVRIDGRTASVSDLKVGHVVRVVARGAEGALATRAIDVTSEVVGPVEAVERGRLTVLGQRVSATVGESGRWKVGDRVAVSGLRRPDGVVVASLIEARPDGPARVSGPVRRGANGAPTIGALRLDGIAPGLVGRRAVVTGDPAGAALAVSRGEEARALFRPGLTRLSIEAYVGRRGAGLNLGSGDVVSGAPDAALPRRGSVRAVLTTDVARDGRLTVERLRIDDRIDRRTREGPREDGFGRATPRETMPGRIDRLNDPNRPSGFERPGGAGPRGFEIDPRTPGGGPGGGPGGFGGPGEFGRGGPMGGPAPPGGFGGGAGGSAPGGPPPGGPPPGGGFGGGPGGGRGR
ncbi:DUF5666 domain-containing protein [Methylobacterium sp. J-090]|uniref:DUF5666 domain-containing protein n=1 Tax=Methylobacterium sp. J-090 TaxID=2836666 RepID=UPI001FBB8EE2|nr:DUF5666 domain-containing protein [Methylobacterium sp. J-090]MCJ2080342.1 DUF5666 domain-containing protein [Methylobacterium sp. J-090]